MALNWGLLKGGLGHAGMEENEDSDVPGNMFQGSDGLLHECTL